MAVTVIVLSGADDGTKLSLTLDTPRLVLGRGEGCDVRLPDPSVSHRHASLRQRGAEYVLMDENSLNGTCLGPVRLPPQTPRVIRSGEKFRLGRVWLEVRLEPAIVKGSTAAQAKEVALSLVARGLVAQGEDPGPNVVVLGGPDAGKAWIIADQARPYLFGCEDDSDMVVTDPKILPTHLRLVRKGEAILVQDLAPAPTASIDGEPLGRAEATWKPGQTLSVGGTQLGFDYLAAKVLLELEQSPDELLPNTDGLPPPATAEAEKTPGPPTSSEPVAETPAPLPRLHRPPEASSWSFVDAIVLLLALTVLGASIVGAWWVLGR